MRNEYKKSMSQSTSAYPFGFYYVDKMILAKDREKLVAPAPSDYYARAEYFMKHNQEMLAYCPNCFYKAS